MESPQIKPKILVTTKLPEHLFSLLSEKCEILFYWQEDSDLSIEELKNHIADCEGVFCLLSNKFDKELISSAKSLKVISTMSVGYDHICIESCRERGTRFFLITFYLIYHEVFILLM
jgi:glyoxylate reductase